MALPTLKGSRPAPKGSFRVIEEHFALPTCRFASDDARTAAIWLRENGGYGQPIMRDAGLHLKTADGQYIRSGPSLDQWIDGTLNAAENQ